MPIKFKTQISSGAGIHSGPVICKTSGPNDKTPNPFLYSQPAAQDSLNITIIPCTTTTCLNAHQAQLVRAITKHYEQQYKIPGLLAGIWIP